MTEEKRYFPGVDINPEMRGQIPVTDKCRFAGKKFDVLRRDNDDFRGQRWFVKIEGVNNEQLVCFPPAMSESEFRSFFPE